MSIKITSHGHSTFSVNIDGINLVVDPFFAENNPVAVKAVPDVIAEYILQTHGHYDHIQDTVELAKLTGAQVIANAEIISWINAQDYNNTHVLSIGESYEFPFGRVQMTAAVHGNELPDGSDAGEAAGYLIFAEGGTLYFAGDTDLFADMSLIGAEGIDAAVIPTGDMVTMGPDEALASLDYLRPKVVIPCHYNTYPQIIQDMQAWADRVIKETSVKPIVLDVEESYEL